MRVIAVRTVQVLRIVSLCTVLLICMPAGASGLIGEVIAVETADAPVALVIADFNLDGSPDIAVGQAGAGSVRVFQGDGQGGVEFAGEYAVGGEPSALTAGDFDQDGNIDIAVTDRFGGRLVVLHGDGQGGLTVASSMALRGGPVSVASADIDDDNLLDLVVAQEDASVVSLLLGLPGGDFAAPTELAVGGRPLSIACVDWNADGSMDLLAADAFHDQVVHYSGDGSGGFTESNRYPVGRQPAHISVTDVNSDGLADAVVTNRAGGSLTVILNNRQEQPQILDPVPVTSRPAASVATDFNGDGAIDIVVAHPLEDAISLMAGRGDGTFDSKATIPLVNGPVALGAADFDGDGAYDVALTAANNDIATVLLADGVGAFVAATQLSLGGNVQDMDTIDFNSDGYLDLFALQLTADGNRVVLFRGDGNGRFEAGIVVAEGDDYADVLEIGDTNSDNALDLVVGGASERVFLGDGTGSFELVWENRIREMFDVAIDDYALGGDFDGDGNKDLITTITQNSTIPGNPPAVRWGDGEGHFDEFVFAPGPFSRFGCSASDFNQDGIDDFVCDGGGELEVRLSNGDRSFTLVESSLGDTNPCDVTSEEASGGRVIDDFNGDGALDIASSITGRVLIFRGDGTGHFELYAHLCVTGSGNPTSAGANGIIKDSLEQADFNDDGIPDLINLQNGVATVFIGDSDGGFAPRSAAVGGNNRMVVGDFNGDGLPDALLGSRVRSEVTVALNQLGERGDINNSNRVDGQDLNTVSRLFGKAESDPDYNPLADINLDGIIDGLDLNRVALQFGEVIRRPSPFRPELDRLGEPAFNTVDFRQVPSEDDLLNLDIVVNDTDGVASADFSVVFERSGEGTGNVFQYVGHEAGDYLSGGLSQLVRVTPVGTNRLDVNVTRLPTELETADSGVKSVVRLKLKAIRAGAAVFDFEPRSLNAPALLNGAGEPVQGVTFVGGAIAQVTSGELPPSLISISPEHLDFGVVPVGTTARKRIRITNFGEADLHVSNVTSSHPDVTTYFVNGFSVTSQSHVELFVVYTPSTSGMLDTEILIESDDAQNPVQRVRVTGGS